MTFQQMMDLQSKIVQNIKRWQRDPLEVTVVWAGGELLPPREESPDDRINQVPSYDLDEGEGKQDREKRKYTRTGIYASQKVETIQ